MRKGTELYDRVSALEQDWLYNEVRRHIINAIQPILLVERQATDALDQSNERRAVAERFLNAIKAAWEDHQLCMGMITDALMYMVRLQIMSMVFDANIICLLFF